MTIVAVEGRRMMRLARQLPGEQFDALLSAYQRLVTEVLSQGGGRGLDVSGDSVSARFPSPREAVFAAAAVQRGLAEHEWPDSLRPEASIGIHFGEAAALRCEELCDAAEGGQTFLSPLTAGLLEGEDLGEWSLRDLGEVRTRRGGELVRAYELVAADVPF